MSGSFASFAACRQGVIAVEMALCAPFLVLVLYVLAEGGYMLSQANAVAKGLRAGAMYVARSPEAASPSNMAIEAATQAAVDNLVKRGTVDSKAAYLIPGWKSGTVTVTRIALYPTFGVNVPIWQVAASVPYTPLFSGGPTFTFNMTHAQAYIGQ